MSRLQEVKESTQRLRDDNVDPGVIAMCYHNQLVNAIAPLVSRAKLSKMSDTKLEKLLQLIEEKL